jgi:CubicO group peptidase (beta-lactamase class C family)
MTIPPGRSIAIASVFLALSSAFAYADEVDGYAAQFIDAKGIPGLSLAVVRDGTLIKAAGYGTANLESGATATPETVYEIGSITKQFTAEAVMLLVEERKLALDDGLSKHLEGLPPAWQELTLRQLLSHTSGLKDWESEHLLSFRREYTPAEFIALLSPYPLDFAPGTHWAYTNSAYPLLGLVIARASGTSYDEFVAAHIFKPLGMGATRFSRPQDIVPHRAGGYVGESGQMRKGELLRPRLVEPNGGILSTVLDLAKWESVLHSERLLKQASLAEMQTRVKLADGRAAPSGLGIFVGDLNGHRMLVHNGSTPGGFSSVIYHYPDDKLTVIVLCNIDRDDAVNGIATYIAGIYVPGLRNGDERR